MILEAAIAIGSGVMNVEKRMVRAALIDVYIERTSTEEGELLMDLMEL